MYYKDTEAYRHGESCGQVPENREVTILSEVDTTVLHGSTYHTDDVLTAVLVKLWKPDIQILRVNDADVVAEHMLRPQSLVADIGRGDFDHHQDDAARRADGGKHAACGLVFEAIRDLLPLPIHQKITLERLIPLVEDTDNTGRMAFPHGVYNDLSAAINATRPTYLETRGMGAQAMESGFATATRLLANLVSDMRGNIQDPATAHSVSVLSLAKNVSPVGAQGLLDYVQGRKEAQQESDAVICNILLDTMQTYNTEQTGIVVFQEPMPWMRIAAMKEWHQIRAGIMPDERSNGWLVTSPKTRDGNNWLPCPSLIQTGKDGCIFLHSSRFMAVFDTFVSAMKAAEAMVANERENIALVTDEPSRITDIAYPSIEVCKAAVRANPEVLALLPIKDREIDAAADEARLEQAPAENLDTDATRPPTDTITNRPETSVLPVAKMGALYVPETRDAMDKTPTDGKDMDAASICALVNAIIKPDITSLSSVDSLTDEDDVETNDNDLLEPMADTDIDTG